MTRLHLGNGDVYLTGPGIWTNIDLHIPGYSFLASERPDLVEKNRTTLERYYVSEYTKVGPQTNRLCVCDIFMDARKLEFDDDTVDEILAVQIFEHFTRTEAVNILQEWRRVLRPSGTVTIDVPDFHGLSEMLLNSSNEFDEEYLYRMIFGSQKNEFAHHKDGYSYSKLRNLMLQAGFNEVIDVGNILKHPYPAVTLRGRK